MAAKWQHPVEWGGAEVTMTPELGRRLARAVARGDATNEERLALMQICDYAVTWDDLPPWWQTKIERWEAP